MLHDLFPNGYVHYLTGGLLIGAGISLLFVTTGRVGGASSVFTTTCSFWSKQPYFQQQKFVGTRGWRLVYAAGMVLGVVVTVLLAGAPAVTAVPWWALLLGGFVGGFGARMAGGCTSGHGVCGMASLQPASFVAVATFLLTAFGTANLVRALGGL